MVFIRNYTQRYTQKEAYLSIMNQSYGEQLFSFRASVGAYVLQIKSYEVTNGTETLYAEHTYAIFVVSSNFIEIFTDFIRYALAALILDLRRNLICMVNY